MYISILLVVGDDKRPSLKRQLESSPHTVVVVGSTDDPQKTISLCAEFHPDVIVVDPDLDNGDLLLNWKSLFGIYPMLLCATSTTDYAQLAFNAGALHYVVHDREDSEISSAIQRCVSQLIRYDRGDTNGASAREKIATFSPQLVALPSADGIDMRAPHEFVSAHGEGNYTRVVLQRDPPMLLSRPLGELESHFERAGMMRVHRSHMVNLNHIRHVRRGKSPVVHLSNGEQVDVSESYRTQLFDLLQIRICRRQDQS